MKKIKINVPEKEYNVYLGNNTFPSLPNLLSKEKIKGKFLLVIDSNVKKYYSKLINDTFANYSYNIVIVNSSEKNKSFETLQKIHSVLIKNKFGRDSVLVAIGGGIIGDIAGFAASTYMRGIKYIQIPTTLLASVDSSVGGKTGLNFQNTKNVIGSFYQPQMVLIDTAFFNTLPNEERLCGLGEIIKYCFLIDQKFYNYVQKNYDEVLSNNPKVLEKVITESVKFKGGVVEADERESGIRKVLNLGHTFAHAFEVQQNHKIKHGQAVIVGITCALYLSHYLNFVNEKDLENYLSFLLFFSPQIKLSNVNKKKIFTIMQLDKKNRDNKIKFVLLQNVGEILTDVPASKELVYKAIAKTVSHF
ncbi:MAG: 3-dehydroquinate synthase [Ignavibacteriae bacterium]|nr:3-dehydroquinate synthase [Ignavibacteriota bacterium]